MRPLSPLEIRVLAVLVEKQATVPDTYPMSINAMTNGCNQKTSRDPVMDATEGEVQLALDGLKLLDLVYETSGGRVTKYAHNFSRVVGVPSQAVALLTVLMLRGPQTLAELRQNSERLHKFADISAVEGFVHELREKSLMLEIPKAAGARESRWMHLLAGEVECASVSSMHTPHASVAPADISLSELAALKARVDALENRSDTLQTMVAKLCAELGIETKFS